MVFTNTVVMSEKNFEAMSDAHQEAVQGAATASCKHQNKLFRADADHKLQLLLAKGVKVTVPYRQPFIEASKVVYDRFLKSDEDKALLKIIHDTE